MTGCEVYLNGDKICTAAVGGLISSTADSPREHVTWLDAKLVCGDYVSVGTISTQVFDSPLRRKKEDPRLKHEERESRRRAYEAMKLEYEGEG